MYLCWVGEGVWSKEKSRSWICVGVEGGDWDVRAGHVGLGFVLGDAAEGGGEN